MSADTTTLVVRTKRRDGREGYEYRVVCVQNAEALTECPDYPRSRPVVNRAYLEFYFANATVFYDGNLAQAEARRIERGTFVEYGIEWVRFNGICFPSAHDQRSARSC